VKSIRKLSYVFVQKEKWNIESPNTYLALLIFEDGKFPESYLIPATAWETPNELFCDRDYVGLKSKLEYGLNISKKNMKLLQEYKMEDVIRIARLNSKGRLNTGAVGDIRKNVTEARR